MKKIEKSMFGLTQVWPEYMMFRKERLFRGEGCFFLDVVNGEGETVYKMNDGEARDWLVLHGASERTINLFCPARRNVTTYWRVFFLPTYGGGAKESVFEIAPGCKPPRGGEEIGYQEYCAARRRLYT